MVTACTSRSPPTNAPFQEAPRPPNGSSRSPRERGLLMPTLNACRSTASLPASSVSSQARLATSAPLEAFIAASSSSVVSTTTIVSTGPNGSACISRDRPGGASSTDGATYAEVSCPARNGAPVELAPVQRHRAAADRLVDLAAQLVGLGGADQRAEVQLGQRVAGGPVVADGERVAEPDRADHRQVHVEELVDQVALHDEPRVRGAALLAVLEALLEVRGEQVPLGEVPDAPGVEALLLDEVPLVGVEQRGGDLAAVGAAADERDRADLGCADQHLGQLLAAAGQRGWRAARRGASARARRSGRPRRPATGSWR